LSDKKADKKDDPHRQIVPILTGEPQAIFEWLEPLFDLSPRDTAPKGTEPAKPKSQPDSMPASIMMRPVYGRGATEIGPPIDQEDWKPTMSPVPSREKLVELANRFYGKAKQHCSAVGSRSRYGLFAYSHLKGPNAYNVHLFVVFPGPKEYSEKEVGPATDDEDTNKDRFTRDLMAHTRWMTEQQTEAMAGVAKLQQDIIRQQAETIARQDSERRAWILASEEALSRKQEREIAAEQAKLKATIFTDMWNNVKGFLPAIAAYATKGKVGVVEGLKQFMDTLSEEVAIALFGKWENGKRITPGILDEDQCKLLSQLADGVIEPVHMSDFITGLRVDQMMEAQRVLSPEQVRSLVALGQAVQASNANGASA
jgi:hypothetical protein